MGIYNEYYQKYYSNIKKHPGIKEYTSAKYNESKGSSSKKFKGSRNRSSFPIYLNIMGKGFANILIIQCVVIIILTSGLFVTKLYPSGYIRKAYDVGLNYVNNGILQKEEINKEDVVQVFNQVKAFVTFEEKQEEYIRKNYVFPISEENKNKITIEGNKLLVDLKEEGNVNSSYSGKVKSISKGNTTTLLINHGGGIEIKYSGLYDSGVTEGDNVHAGDIIGKFNGGENNRLSIEVFYMGSLLSPEKCFDLAALK